jgi:multidrug efflux pump subunit AcrA (membrane-fusion protein)
MTHAPAGWYPAPEGGERYWDGTAWTEKARTLAATSSGPAWYSRRWVQLVAVAVVALTIGGAVGGSSSSAASDRATKAKAEAASAHQDLATAQAAAETAASDAQDQIATLQAQADGAQKAAATKAAAAYAARKAALDARQQSLDARSRALDVRTAKVTGMEATAAANTIPGDGVYIVGQDISPGTYKSAGGAGCYWSRNDKGNGIVDNYIGDGATVIVVHASDFSVEIAGCADFHKVG